MDKLIIKKYYTEPKDKINIISVSVFRLEKNYKSTMRYFYGLNTLVNNFHKYYPGFYLRIYFDSSINKTKHKNDDINKEVKNKWKPFFTKIKKYKNVQLCKYTYPDFMYNDLYHYGLFGTFVRFMPLFDYNDMDNIQNVIISDIDFSDSEFKDTSKDYTLFKKSNSKFHFKTMYCYAQQPRFYDVEKKLDKKYVPDIWMRILAGSIFSKIKFPKYLFDDFIKCTQNLDKDECNYLQYFNYLDKNYVTKAKKELGNTIFIYGIDEYFINTTFYKYILNNKIQFSYRIILDIAHPIFNLYSRNNKFETPNEYIISFFKEIMGKYYDNNKNLLENYNYFDKIIYFMNYYENNKRKQIYEYFFHRLINFMKNNYKNKNYKKFGFNKSEAKCIMYQTNPYGIRFIEHDYI